MPDIIIGKCDIVIDGYVPTKEESMRAAQQFYNEYMSARYFPNGFSYARMIAKLPVRMKEMG